MRTTGESKRVVPVTDLARTVLAGLVAVALSGSAGLLRAQTADEAARLFATLGLDAGMTVGEIGAGRGEMSVELAKRLGPAGHVYSTEIDANRLADIRQAISREGLANVTVIEAGDRVTNLPDACCDAVFMRDVYHHLTNPDEIGRSIATALKPGGRLAVIDFDPRPGTAAPDGVPDNRGGHGVRPETIADELTRAGLVRTDTVALWLDDTQRNRRMFLVLFTKPR